MKKITHEEIELLVQNDKIAYDALTFVAKQLDTGGMKWGEAFYITVQEVNRAARGTLRPYEAADIYQAANDTLNYLSNHIKEL